MNTQPQMPQSKETDSTSRLDNVRTKPQADTQLPDANVDNNGHCILPQNAEAAARPDTGEPCDDGRAG